MVIALLAVLGVDLMVIVALLVLVLGRKRWVTRQRGAFRGAVRVAGGHVDGFGPKWRRGYGRWVRDILVWTKGPLLFRNELLATDEFVAQGTTRPGEIKRLGDQPGVATFKAGDATVEIAARGEDTALLAGPYGGRPVGG